MERPEFDKKKADMVAHMTPEEMATELIAKREALGEYKVDDGTPAPADGPNDNQAPETRQPDNNQLIQPGLVQSAEESGDQPHDVDPQSVPTSAGAADVGAGPFDDQQKLAAEQNAEQLQETQEEQEANAAEDEEDEEEDLPDDPDRPDEPQTP